MRSRLIWIFAVVFVLIGFQYAFALISTPTAISGGTEAADGIIDTNEATDADQIQIRVYFNSATNTAGNTVRLLNGTTPANFTTSITTTMTAADVTNGFINFTLSNTQLPNGPYRIKAQINNATHISAVGPVSFLNFTVSVFPVSTGGSGPDTKSSAISFDPPPLISEELPDLVINGESYFLDQYDRLVSKDDPGKSLSQQVSAGQPFEFSFEFYSELGSDNIQHISLYPNMHGKLLGSVRETYVSLDKRDGKTIHDPDDLISDASIILQDGDNKVNVITSIDFAKDMELSDLVIRIWDKDRYAITKTIKDFIQVDLPESFDPEHQKAYEGLEHEPEPKVSEPEENDLDQVSPPETISEPKITTQLFGIESSENQEQYAKSNGVDYKDGQIRIALSIDESQDILSRIADLGNVESSSSGLVQITADIDKIQDILEIQGVNKVQIPIRAIQNGIISEGVKFVQADQIQKKGTLGKGIKIAVLDLGFDTANTEFGKVVESKSFRYDFGKKLVPVKGIGHEYVHGTAVVEIITDVAPKSELYLYTFSTEAEFLQAMDYAISKKVNMISMSAGWMNYMTDSTSPMTKKVEEAINKGITFVVSAGNYAETHWEGKFADADSDGWHEFSGTDEGLSFTATQTRIANQIPIVVYVMWNGPKLVDLNLVLTDKDGQTVASSSNVQKSKGDEFEYIYYIPETPGTYSLGVSSSAKKPDASIEVFAQNDVMEYSTAVGSVSVPTDAKGVISVGAVNYKDSKIEPFSSQGPTNNGKSVPDIVGPDAVQTVAYGSPFYGTSAAQPHVAGIVALMLEKNPKLTSSQILGILQQNADKTGLPIKGNSDNIFGYGKATANSVGKEAIAGTTAQKNKSAPEVKPAVRQKVQQQDIAAEPAIPSWIKQTMGWWSTDKTSDKEFVSATQYLVKQEIISISQIESIEEGNMQIPSWIKQTMGWWSTDQISDKEFISAIEFLIEQGIVKL